MIYIAYDCPNCGHPIYRELETRQGRKETLIDIECMGKMLNQCQKCSMPSKLMVTVASAENENIKKCFPFS